MAPDQQLAPGRPIRAAVYRGRGEPVRVTGMPMSASPGPGAPGLVRAHAVPQGVDRAENRLELVGQLWARPGSPGRNA